MNIGNDYGEKKKTKNKKIKLTNNQVESLERSFQEEIKLDPETKMRLSDELGLQPRQIAVWFQNRRTRWKTKQLEHSNNVLKHSCDMLKQENQKLKEEVVELTEKLKEKVHPRTQTFGDESLFEGFGEVEGYDLYPSSHIQQGTTRSTQQAAEGYINSSFIIEDFDTVSLLQECHWPWP